MVVAANRDNAMSGIVAFMMFSLCRTSTPDFDRVSKLLGPLVYSGIGLEPRRPRRAIRTKRGEGAAAPTIGNIGVD